MSHERVLPGAARQKAKEQLKSLEKEKETLVSDLIEQQCKRNAGLSQYLDTWRNASDEWKQSPAGKTYQKGHLRDDEMACQFLRQKRESISKIDRDIGRLKEGLTQSGCFF
jgi:hypothetical protein